MGDLRVQGSHALRSESGDCPASGHLGGKPSEPLLLRADTDSPQLDRGRYATVYSLSGPPGAVLVQQVSTRIRYTRGEHTLVSYRGSYLESFQLDGEGQTQRDVHDLDLRRDGWDLAAVRRLLKRHGLDHSSGRESRLSCVKTFKLALGTIEGAAVQAGPPGQAFCFLAEGPVSVGAAVTIAAANGSGEQTILPESPCPFGTRPAGRCCFIDDTGWVLHEVFDYRFSTGTGHFSHGPGYHLSSLFLSEPRDSSGETND